MSNFPFYLAMQIPTDVPHPDDNSAIDISNTFDLVVYIILPIVLILLYFFWYRKKGK